MNTYPSMKIRVLVFRTSSGELRAFVMEGDDDKNYSQDVSETQAEGSYVAELEATIPTGPKDRGNDRWTDAQIERLYRNSSKFHSDVKSFAAFKRLVRYFEILRGIKKPDPSMDLLAQSILTRKPKESGK